MMTMMKSTKMIKGGFNMEKARFCEACGKALILDKEHHKVVRNTTEKGLGTAFSVIEEPIQYDAFDCEYCGCQTIIGERKREIYEVKFEDTEEDIKVESEPQDGQISSPEDGINEDDLADIKKKIEEAGE